MRRREEQKGDPKKYGHHQGHKITLRSLGHSLMYLALMVSGEGPIDSSVHKNHFQQK